MGKGERPDSRSCLKPGAPSQEAPCWERRRLAGSLKVFGFGRRAGLCGMVFHILPMLLIKPRSGGPILARPFKAGKFDEKHLRRIATLEYIQLSLRDGICFLCDNPGLKRPG